LWHGSWGLGVIVGIAMFASILVAATTGTVFPMLFRRFGLDPALATGPFVTTSNDVINLFIYFVVASLLSRRF
ncbi:MAG: magnesium transporter, partial [Candidatus Eisenbacteria bacterium]